MDAPAAFEAVFAGFRQLRCDDLLAVLPIAVSVLVAYGAGGALIPYTMSLRSFRVRRHAQQVRLSGLDALTMACMGAPLVGLSALAAAGGAWACALTTLVAVTLWFGFRVQVVVTGEKATLWRLAFWVLPWRWQTLLGQPRLFVDGWGDFLDPEALILGASPSKETWDLAWSLQTHGQLAEKLAAEFNLAVRELRAPGAPSEQ